MGFPAQEVATMKKCLAIAVLLLVSSLTSAQAQYTFEYGASTAPCSSSRSSRPAGACSRCRASAPTAATETGRRSSNFDPSVCKFAARRVADGGKGRQGADRSVRRQSLWLFRRQEVEPER